MDKKQVIANANNLPISTKVSVEISSFIRGKSIERAKKILENVIKMKEAIPYKRYNQEMPHRKGKIATGRYPVKACKEFLNLLSSVKSNAKDNSMNPDLLIDHISAHRGPFQWHGGRKRRRKMKSTHLKISVVEKKETKKVEKK